MEFKEIHQRDYIHNFYFRINDSFIGTLIKYEYERYTYYTYLILEKDDELFKIKIENGLELFNFDDYFKKILKITCINISEESYRNYKVEYRNYKVEVKENGYFKEITPEKFIPYYYLSKGESFIGKLIEIKSEKYYPRNNLIFEINGKIFKFHINSFLEKFEFKKHLNKTLKITHTGPENCDLAYPPDTFKVEVKK